MRIPFANNSADQQKGSILVTITPEGEEEAKDFAAEDDYEFRILASLSAKRPQTISQLAKNTGINFNDCLKACKSLKVKGYISQK